MGAPTFSSMFRKVFLLTKVDELKRLVSGVMADETPDATGEVFDYATSKPYFEAWSQSFADTTDGKSLGNLRSMHSPVAAGKFTDIVFDDIGLSVLGTAKVVDDAEWNKVIEGVYTGFSIGGRYVKRWTDTAGVRRYTADPIETSLVDAPCNPNATFAVVKADGTTEERAFQAPSKQETEMATNNAIAMKARELAKSLGSEDKWPDFIEAAIADLAKSTSGASADVSGAASAGEGAGAATFALGGAAQEERAPAPTNETVNKTDAEIQADVVSPTDVVKQRWLTTDGKDFAKKADAVKHQETISKSEEPKDPLMEALAGLSDRVSKIEGTAEVVRSPEFGFLAKVSGELAGSARLAKSFSHVSRLASIIEDLQWLMACVEWSDGTEAISAALLGNAKGLCDTLISLVQKETSDLVADTDCGDVVIVELAESAEMGKTKYDALEKTLGSLPAAETFRTLRKRIESEKAKNEANLVVKTEILPTKTPEVVELAKFEAVQAANDALQKSINTAMDAITGLSKRLEAVETAPRSGGPARTSVGVVVSKSEDTGIQPPQATNFEQELLKRASEDPQKLSLMLIKATQATGGRPINL